MKLINFKKQSLLITFTLALTVSVSMGRAVLTQTPVTACDQLREDVKVEARKDAQADRFNFFNSAYIKRKTLNDVIKLYSDQNPNASCFKNNKQLWDIYINEYETYKYPAGIPVILILVLGGVIGIVISDTLKKWLNQFLESAEKYLYKEFAGTPLIDNIILKKYRKSIIDNYQQIHILFRPNSPLKMRDIYVPLRVTCSSDRSLIEAQDAIQKYSRLMVKGAPGSGKSILLKYIALTYIETSLDNLSRQPIVPILLELHRLNDPKLTVERIEQELIKVCDRHQFPKANRFISESLKQGRLMLLFDGLDEVNSSIRSEVVHCIKDLLTKYKECRVIITCRTAVYSGQFDNIVDKTLDILESKEAQPIIDEIVHRSGLLLSIDGGERYQFTHQTLQEYFVAEALREKEKELIQRWKIASTDWLEIVKLWCGLANDSTALIEAVYEPDPLTAFECLADAQQVNPEVGSLDKVG